MNYPGGMHYRRANIIGVGVDPVSYQGALDRALELVASKRGGAVAAVNAHSLVEAQSRDWMRRFFAGAQLVLPDGMPLVWCARYLGFSETERVCGSSFMTGLCRVGLNYPVRHYFYGGRPGIPERLARRLKAASPDLLVVGTCSPPFGPITASKQAQLLDDIRVAKPDVLWVALGSVRQERWIAKFQDELPGIVLAGVGAAFDFNSGLKPRAPLWMQRSGLEWLHRLCQEPQRLGYRYLVNNPRFILAVASQVLKLRSYELSRPRSEGSIE